MGRQGNGSGVGRRMVKGWGKEKGERVLVGVQREKKICFYL